MKFVQIFALLWGVFCRHASKKSHFQTDYIHADTAEDPGRPHFAGRLRQTDGWVICCSEHSAQNGAEVNELL